MYSQFDDNGIISSQPDIVEDFYGVYILYCKNPDYFGKIYIGYTVNPNRRINQHNKGRIAGGAKKTSNKGPWIMALIVHGFPNSILALQFEWAWQFPWKSRRLSKFPDIKKTRKETLFQYNIRVLAQMLRVGPWHRLPLTIRWLAEDLYMEFPTDKLPPLHMPICHGKVVSKKVFESNITLLDCEESLFICYLCAEEITDKLEKITCLDSSCLVTTHVICLANIFLETDSNEFIPIQGHCPKCKKMFLWGDLIRRSRGCYKDFNEIEQQFITDSENYLDLS